VLERMSELAPREMRRAWTAAFGNARLAGRDAIEPGDLPAAANKRGTIGFSAH
jgi:ATP-dependent Lon protease